MVLLVSLHGDVLELRSRKIVRKDGDMLAFERGETNRTLGPSNVGSVFAVDETSCLAETKVANKMRCRRDF